MKSRANIGGLNELSQTFKTSHAILKFAKILVYNKKGICFLTYFKVGAKL